MQSGIAFWKEAPFTRVLFPFVAGILVQYYTGNPPLISFLLLVLAPGALFIFSLLKPAIRFRWFAVQGALINLAIFSAGAIICEQKNPFNTPKQIDPLLEQGAKIAAVVGEPPLKRKSTWKAHASLQSVGNKTTEGDILIYFRVEDAQKLPKYGDKIVFTQPLNTIKNFAGRKGFDYKRFCALKNIHYQVFLSENQFAIFPGRQVSLFRSFIFRLQDATIQHLKKYIPDQQACGLAMALLIGYKNELDRSLISSYSNTGVVHVIAISGLHLGIIYTILLLLCKPLEKRGFRIPVALVVIAGLWLFSILAGASPSVLRSAVMFSCIAIGKAANKQTSLFNNLSSSAFLLLCYDPFWLFDLGFQLSYGALCSIAFYSRNITNLFAPGSKILSYIWKANAVTISAQILTAPILLFQFQQFPNLFIPANFIAIPASTIILLGEIALCILAFSPTICSFLGQVLVYLIRMLNMVVTGIDALPFSTLSGINLNLFQTILLYLFIMLVSCWLMYANRRLVPLSLLVLIVFFVAGLPKIWL